MAIWKSLRKFIKWVPISHSLRNYILGDLLFVYFLGILKVNFPLFLIKWCVFSLREKCFHLKSVPILYFLCQRCLWFANVALLNGSSCHVISTQCLLCVSRKDSAKGKTLYADFGVLMFSITQLRKKHIKMHLNWWDLIDTSMAFRSVFPWMEVPWATDLAPMLWFLVIWENRMMTL